MRKVNLLFTLLVLFALASCEFKSYEEHGIKPYDGELNWTEIVKKADWKMRRDHAATVFDNKIWIVGGYNSGQVVGDSYYEDVWSSSDGDQWTEILAEGPFLGRRGHSLITFDDGSGEAMYLIGGFTVNGDTGYREYANDVWKSTDGINWEKIKERTYPEKDASDDWFPRMDMSCVVANHGGIDYIYLITGYTMFEEGNGTYGTHYFDDVWRSTDGVSWTKLANNDFSERTKSAATVDPNTGTIYIQGGRHGVIFEPSSPGSSSPDPDWNKLWSSTDGVVWNIVHSTDFDNGVLNRGDHAMHFYQGQIWTFSGMTTSNAHYGFAGSGQLAIWNYDPAGTWKVDSYGSAIHGRHGYASVVFDDKIWILGGFTSHRGQANDVWTAEK